VPSARLVSFFKFPNPVNELAARTVAAGVVVLCVAILVTRQGWLLVPLAYGFWARVSTGPKASPLGQFAVRVVAPRLGLPRPVPGPPKRFAQAMGTAFSTAAVVTWFGFGSHLATFVLVGMLTAAALLEPRERAFELTNPHLNECSELIRTRLLQRIIASQSRDTIELGADRVN